MVLINYFYSQLFVQTVPALLLMLVIAANATN